MWNSIENSDKTIQFFTEDEYLALDLITVSWNTDFE